MRILTIDPAGQPERDARISGELDRGEEVIWAGRPQPRLLARASWPIALFAVPFLGFAIFWTVMAVVTGPGSGSAPAAVSAFFPLFGLPFIVVGVWMLTTPLRAHRSARRALYVLTDRRAIIWAPQWRSERVVSFGPESLDDLHRTQRRDGSGDLIFRQRTAVPAGESSTQPVREGFVGVTAVAELEKLVRQTLERAPR